MQKKNQFFLVILLLIISLYSTAQLGEMVGTPWTGPMGVSETVNQIMARNVLDNNIQCKKAETEKDWPDRTHLAQNPLAPAVSRYPYNTNTPTAPIAETPQTLGTSFTGATLSGTNPTNSFPPDNMGAVGPTQYIISVNGRLVTYNKTTGIADGALNTTQDNFFASVISSNAGTFTSDPRIRYDRKSQRWIFLIIDVPAGTGALPNRILIGVSNTSTITPATAFTFFFFQQQTVTPAGNTNDLADYPTLGVDDNALYIGCNMFTSGTTYNGTSAWVVRKSSIMGAGPIVVSAFRGLALGTGAGPYTPQGVDNMDATSTDGYFIGTDNATYSTLQIRRVTNPGTTPVISANITLIVPTTNSSLTVPHLGNTVATNGRLDALDDRLYAAVIRNGHLWTAHSIQVTTAGVAGTTNGRNACRWYDISNLSTTPSLTQSGTIFDNAASSPVFYSIPSVMVSGQGHAAFAMTSAGLAAYANASTVGRLSGDAAGTTGTKTNTTASSTAYNPPSDPGNSGSRRWGDYSYVSLDPIDDQTMWMVHQFCDATNSYGSRITKLIAPPPATPTTVNPSVVGKGQASTNIVVTGTSVTGSGFYDPGTNLSGALPFNHISAAVSGGVVVNSVTYTDPTHITININTVNATMGTSTITVTNPDGQVLASATPILTITAALPVSLLELKGKLNNNTTVLLNWSTSSETNNRGFYIERNETNNLAGWTSLGFVTGAGNSNSSKQYSFTDNNIELNKIYRYRLKQVDINGQVKYSTELIIRVNDLQKQQILLSVYPNPVAGSAAIRYNLPEAGMTSLKLFDLLGKEITTITSGFQSKGAYYLPLDVNRLAINSGIYVLKLSCDARVVSNSISIIK